MAGWQFTNNMRACVFITRGMLGSAMDKSHTKTKYLLSPVSVVALLPAIFMAICPNASPAGTRRARAVIAGADDLNDVYINRLKI